MLAEIIWAALTSVFHEIAPPFPHGRRAVRWSGFAGAVIGVGLLAFGLLGGSMPYRVLLMIVGVTLLSSSVFIGCFLAWDARRRRVDGE